MECMTEFLALTSFSIPTSRDMHCDKAAGVGGGTGGVGVGVGASVGGEGAGVGSGKCISRAIGSNVSGSKPDIAQVKS